MTTNVLKQPWKTGNDRGIFRCELLRSKTNCHELILDEIKIFRKKESYKIIGACMKVHRELGSGFLEAVYNEALKKEFTKSKIPFESQVKLNVYYSREQLKKNYVEKPLN